MRIDAFQIGKLHVCNAGQGPNAKLEGDLVATRHCYHRPHYAYHERR